MPKFATYFGDSSAKFSTLFHKFFTKFIIISTRILLFYATFWRNRNVFLQSFEEIRDFVRQFFDIFFLTTEYQNLWFLPRLWKLKKISLITYWNSRFISVIIFWNLRFSPSIICQYSRFSFGTFANISVFSAIVCRYEFFRGLLRNSRLPPRSFNEIFDFILQSFHKIGHIFLP